MMFAFALSSTLAAGAVTLFAGNKYHCTWRDALFAAAVATAAGFLTGSFAAACAVGALCAFAIIDARSGEVPFVIALPALALVLAAAFGQGVFYPALVGSGVTASAVGLVLVANQQPRLLGAGILIYVLALLGAAEHWVGALVGAGLGWAGLLWYLRKTDSGMGLSGGDIVLAAFAGAALGWQAGSVALLVGVLIAVGIWAILVRGKDRSLRFGPSLAIGTLLVLWFLYIHPIR
jgi:prepilin signal peptidase PulO-like enzyme (type II secretory pathway)